MSRNFDRANQREIRAGSRQRIRGRDLEPKTLRAEGYTVIWHETASNAKSYFPGAGPNDERTGTGWSDLDVKVDNAGTPEPAEGDMRWVLYGSEDFEDPKRISGTFSAAELRGAVSSETRQKFLMEQLAPAAMKQGRVLALEFKAEEGSSTDGLEVDPAASDEDAGVRYSVVRE